MLRAAKEKHLGWEFCTSFRVGFRINQALLVKVAGVGLKGPEMLIRMRNKIIAITTMVPLE